MVRFLIVAVLLISHGSMTEAAPGRSVRVGSNCGRIVARTTVRLESLPRNDNFRGVIEDLSVEWNDNNITTGRTLLIVKEIEAHPFRNLPTATLPKVSQIIFNTRFRDILEESLPDGIRTTTEGGPISPALLKRAGQILAESNAAAPRSGFQREFSRTFGRLAGFLGPENQTHIYITQARVPNNEDSDQLRTVSTITILNTVTRKALITFTIEGTM